MKAKVTSRDFTKSKKVTCYGLQLPREFVLTENEYFLKLTPINLDTEGTTYKSSRISPTVYSFGAVVNLADGTYPIEVEDGEIYICI